MIELTQDQIQALEDVGISEADVIDGRQVEEGDVIVVTSAGQKVLISEGVATITVGPGYVTPEVRPAPDVPTGDVVPSEEPAPLQPVVIDETTTASTTALPPVESGDTGDVKDDEPKDDGVEPTLEQSFDEMKVEQLKGLLRDRDLPIGGKKAELIERLNAAQ